MSAPYGVPDSLDIHYSSNVARVWARVFSSDIGARGGIVDASADGTLWVMGTMTSESHDSLLIVKLSSAGETIWEKGLRRSSMGGAWGLETTSDGGCLAGFVLYSKDSAGLYVMKLDERGEKKWEAYLPKFQLPWGRLLKLRSTSDGGCVVAGTIPDTDGGDLNAALVRIRPGGEIAWVRRYGGYGTREHGYDLSIAPDGGFVVSCAVIPDVVGGPERLMLVGADVEGIERWKRIYPTDRQETGTSIVPHPGGGYLVSLGWQLDSINFQRRRTTFGMVRVGEHGEEEWRREVPSNDFFHVDLARHGDGFIAAGMYAASRLDSNGAVEWGRDLRHVAHQHSVNPAHVIALPEGDVVFTGMQLFARSTRMRLTVMRVTRRETTPSPRRAVGRSR